MPGMVDPRTDRNGILSIEELMKEKKKKEEAKKLKDEKQVKKFEEACKNPLNSKNATKIAKAGQKNGQKSQGDQVKTQ